MPNGVPWKPATRLCRASRVRAITIRTLKILSYFFRSRCSLVSEERFDPNGVRHEEFQATRASFELKTSSLGRGDCLLRREYYNWRITCDRCHRNIETRKIHQSDYCRACYPIILGLPNPVIDDAWLPVEPFEHLISATRFIAATGRNGAGIWEDFSIGFLHQLPISLAYNTEIVVQILPYLTSLSELPAPLKRYEPQLRFAVDELKWDNRTLMFVVATLQHAWEFQQWHQKHVGERNARDQYFAAHGITTNNYRTADPLLSRLSGRISRRRRIAKALATVWPET